MNTDVHLPDLDSQLLYAAIPVAVLMGALVLWCLVDILRRDHVQQLPKAVWVLIVVLAIPLGSIAYLIAGRGRPHLHVDQVDQHAAEYGALGQTYPAAVPVTPLPITHNPAPTVALRTVGLTRTFAGGGGIRDLDFAAADHAVTAVIGPNGAGKTVLFSVLAGLQSADSGHVIVAPDARMAYCPDLPQFEGWLSAREVVTMSIAVAGVPVTIDPDTALTRCGLEKSADSRVAGFSRGMLQRLGIAAALVLDPDILVLDEPNSALDPIGRADIRRLILEQKRHRCIVLSSHLLSEVEQLADAVIVLDEGRIVADGTATDLLLSGTTPTWTVRLGRACAVAPDRLRARFPEVRIDLPAEDVLTLAFATFSAAETTLSEILGALESPIIEVTLAERDLDSAFARLLTSKAT